MLKLYFQDSMLKSLEVINTFTPQFSSPVLQLTGQGCDITGRERQTLKEGVIN